MEIKNPFTDSDFFPELTPLIDVMFLLLVFFMLTTTFEDESRQKAISVELPKAKKSRAIPRKHPVVLHISENGDYALGENRCSAQTLPDLLKAKLSTAQDSVVLISGHKKAPYHAVVFVYDVLQALGVQHFAHEVQ